MRFPAVPLVVMLAVESIAVVGCVRPVDNPYSLRARTNLDYWNAILTSIREVNRAAKGGAPEQSLALEVAIETLNNMSTSNVDSELVSLKDSTVNLFTSIREYLKKSPASPAVADPTNAGGYLHSDEAKLVEQGIQARLVLIERYRMEFPQGFARSETFRQQPGAAQPPAAPQ